MTKNDEVQFWKMVEICLIKVLKYSAATARRQTSEYRQDLERQIRKHRGINVIMHELPIQVACDVAGIQLNDDHIEQFERITAEPATKSGLVKIPPKRAEAGRSKSLAATGTEGRASFSLTSGSAKAGSGAKKAAAARKAVPAKKPATKSAKTARAGKPTKSRSAR